MSWKIAGALAAAASLTACTGSVEPIEVTRFSAPERIANLGKGSIAVVAAPGEDADSLALRTYQVAVAREIVALGYTETAAEAGAYVAQVRVDRGQWREAARERGPVNVGVGGSTGSYGSHVGVGVGVNLGSLGKGRKEQVATTLSVVIRDRASGAAVWEGRAEEVVKAGEEGAGARDTAARLAAALFDGFPGESGETVEVRP